MSRRWTRARYERRQRSRTRKKARLAFKVGLLAAGVGASIMVYASKWSRRIL